MVADAYDAVIIGAGADGPVVAWKLAEAGLSVLLLEAGPFHGNKQWPKPHEEPGAEASSSVDDLSGELLDEQFTTREFEMVNNLLFGPADYKRGFWMRKFPGDGAILQCAGVGGTTLHYTGCHPRAYPAAIDEQGHWPISYADLIPYYQELEAVCDVTPAPVTAKEELFFRGAAAAGWDLIDEANVTRPGYRPQPNAIRPPDAMLHVDAGYDGDYSAADLTGHTLGVCDISGNPHPRGAPFEEKAKRASNISFVPLGLRTGNLTIRPNAFVTDIKTKPASGGRPIATGVTFRDTWSGDVESVAADVTVLAAGAIETPRLWLNSGLPTNEWVGRGLTIHYGDNVMGLWTAADLERTIGQGTVDQFQGQDIAARFDYPGLGMLQTVGTTPGIGAILGFGASAAGFAFQHDTTGEPWDTTGRLAGRQLKELLAGYRRMLQVLVVSDDHPHRRNGVTVRRGIADEHGPIPLVNYRPSQADRVRRDKLARIAAKILRAGGATHIHRSDSPPTALHLHSTMRMGKVVDDGCEAYDVGRLFVADHSVLANGLGGPNPTLTGQAVAARSAAQIQERYFT